MLLLLLSFASDHPDSQPDPCEPWDEPRLVVGTGEVAYEPISEDPLLLVYGPQGGQHVLIGLEAQGLADDDALTSELVGTMDGETVARSTPYVTFRCNGLEGSPQAWNLFLVLIEGVTPEDVHDRDMDVQVTLTDTQGRTLEASAAVHVYDPSQE